MHFASLSSRTRRVLLVVAIASPLLSLASLAGAALWVRGHGGFAAPLAALVRHAAFFAAGTGTLPGTLPPAQAATLAPPAPAAGWVWLAGGEGRDRDFSFALIEPGKGSTLCFDSERGSAAFRRLSRSATTPTVWFTDDGREYVITDRALVERARTLCEPLSSIGGEMGRVGARMGEHGARIGAVGGRLGALGGRLGGLSAQLATRDLSRGDRARLEAELAEVRAQMGAGRDGARAHGRRRRRPGGALRRGCASWATGIARRCAPRAPACAPCSTKRARAARRSRSAKATAASRRER